MVRTCKACGREYRGLVCQACHPRGSGARARRGLDERVPADCSWVAVAPAEGVSAEHVASHNHCSVSDETGATAVAQPGID